MYGILISIVLLSACAGVGERDRIEGATASDGPWVRAPRGYSVRGSVHLFGRGGDSVRFHIGVRNLGPDPALYSLVACEVAARAYQTSARDEKPVWESLQIRQEDCSGVGMTRTLGVGDSLPSDHWDLVLPVAAVLGDSLPPGRYDFSVSSPLETHPDLRGVLFVPAGAVDLRR